MYILYVYIVYEIDEKTFLKLKFSYISILLSLLRTGNETKTVKTIYS